MAENKLVQLNFETSYNMSNIIHIYAFSMLSHDHILISGLVVADLFMHSLWRHDSTLLGYAFSYTESVFAWDYNC